MLTDLYRRRWRDEEAFSHEQNIVRLSLLGQSMGEVQCGAAPGCFTLSW